MTAHTPWAYLTPRKFRSTTVAYSQGKFLTYAAQHRSYSKSAIGMAKPGFETMPLWLDTRYSFALHFWPHKYAHPQTDLTDPLELSVRSVLTHKLGAGAHTSLNSLGHPQILAYH